MKYDFKGIKEKGAKGLETIVAATRWGSSLLKFPFFATLEDAILQWVVNWLANNGLVVFNLGAIVFDGEVDQSALDSALDNGLKAVKIGREKLKPGQGEAIDEAVRKAARKNIKFGP